MDRRGGAVAVLRAGAVVVALLLVFGACRDGGGDGAASSPAAFAADYQEVSQEFEAEVGRVRTQGQAVLGQGEDALISFYQRLGEATEAALDDYRDLRPPEDLVTLHRRIVDLLEEQVAVLDTLVEHARDASPRLEDDLRKLGRLFAEWAQANREMTRRLEAATTTT